MARIWITKSMDEVVKIYIGDEPPVFKDESGEWEVKERSCANIFTGINHLFKEQFYFIEPGECIELALTENRFRFRPPKSNHSTKAISEKVKENLKERFSSETSRKERLKSFSSRGHSDNCKGELVNVTIKLPDVQHLIPKGIVFKKPEVRDMTCDINFDLAEEKEEKKPIPSDCFTQMIEDAIKDGRLT